MGNAKRERRQRAQLARSQGSAAPPQATAPRPRPSGSPAGEEVIFCIRRGHILDDMLNIARTYHSRGVLPTARRYYEDLLPMAERERGRDDPTTLGIVASLIEVYYAQNDRQAAARLMAARVFGAMAS